MNMKKPGITFQFSDSETAVSAISMLRELGYASRLDEDNHLPRVQIAMADNDLTSALEIAQAYGGTLLENAYFTSENTVFTTAYDLGSMPIPAHVVNEDWPESYRYNTDETVGNAGETGNITGFEVDHFSVERI